MTKDGSLYKGYVNGKLDVSYSNANSITSIDRWYVLNGADAGDGNLGFASNYFNGGVRNVRIWTGIALTAEDWMNEMRSADRPYMFNGLHNWTNLKHEADTRDNSSAGSHWTANATPTKEREPEGLALTPVNRIRRYFPVFVPSGASVSRSLIHSSAVNRAATF